MCSSPKFNPEIRSPSIAATQGSTFGMKVCPVNDQKAKRTAKRSILMLFSSQNTGFGENVVSSKCTEKDINAQDE